MLGEYVGTMEEQSQGPSAPHGQVPAGSKAQVSAHLAWVAPPPASGIAPHVVGTELGDAVGNRLGEEVGGAVVGEAVGNGVGAGLGRGAGAGLGAGLTEQSTLAFQSQYFFAPWKR